MNVLKLFPGGFPGTIETFSFLQDAYSATISALSNMAGDNAILEGIVDTAGTVSEGFFVHDKEVIYFRQSAAGATVRIVEKTIQVPYNEDTNSDGDLDLKDAYVQRLATTDDPIASDETEVANFAFSDLVPITNFRTLIPIGAAMLWFDPNNTPPGYVVADGDGGVGGVLSNGEPVRDLRDMFIKGAGTQNLVNTNGGAREKPITAANLPPHIHGIGNHSHGYLDIYHSEIGGSVAVPGNIGSGDTDDDNTGFQMARTTGAAGAGNTGNGSPALQGTNFNVEPAFYTAIWIQYNGL